jgi:hypothetical protein
VQLWILWGKDYCLITKREFVAAVQEYERESARWAKIAGLFLAASIFGLAAADYAKTQGYLAWLGATNPMNMIGVLWFVGVVALLGLLLLMPWRRRVVCPHCKKQLVQVSARISVATGICSYCGEKIFEQSFEQA